MKRDFQRVMEKRQLNISGRIKTEGACEIYQLASTYDRGQLEFNGPQNIGECKENLAISKKSNTVWHVAKNIIKR